MGQSRPGIDAVTGNSTISKDDMNNHLCSDLSFPIAILALEALNLESVSGPQQRYASA